MSDDEPRRQTADASDDHLADEDLSEALDGAGTAGTDAHVARCPRCGARSQALASARAVAATAPPAPTADRRDAAVAVALAVAQEWAPRSAPSVPPATATTGDLAALRARRRTRPRRDVGPWLGVAAVLALLVGAASLLDLSGSGSDDAATSAVEDSATRAADGDSSTAADEAQTESEVAQEADRSASAAAGPDATVTEQEAADDQADVSEDAGPTPEEEASEAPDEATEEALPDDAGPGLVDIGDVGPIEPGADLTELSRSLRARPDEGGGSASTSVAPAPADLRDGPVGACQDEVRVALGITAPLALIGTATVDGTPATVLGFEGGPDAGPRIAVVGLDCQVLAATPAP